jgi:uncharacterized phiE125 gp8 family phage protein
MALQLITPPAAEPVTLAEAKMHLRDIAGAEDALIAGWITAARQHLDGKDGILGRALMPQTWELVMDAFPCGRISVPLPPLQSVTSISYYDTAGVLQVLSSAAYIVEPAFEPGIVEPVDSWPATKARVGAARIRFVAGYANAAAVPKALWEAMLLAIGDMYENRENGIVGVSYADNPAYDRLVFPYRVNLLG